MTERVLGPFYDTPERAEFESAVAVIWGERWRQPAAVALMVNLSTLDRWATGKTRVPGPAIACLRLLQRRPGPKRKR